MRQSKHPLNEPLSEKCEHIEFWTEAIDFILFNETLDCIRWLAKRRLLRNSVLRQTCQIPMSFVRKMDLTDGYRWKCKTCSRVTSIRNDSFFSGSHQILLIIYGWAKDYAQKDIAHEAKLGEHSTHTKVDWCAFCRDEF
jgi:hypothetical protein